MNSPHSASTESTGSVPLSDSFWQRWLSYQPTLLRQARRLLGHQSADAEDAVSATLLRALQHLQSTASPILDERAWLSRILYSVCMDEHRHRKRFAEPAPQEAEAPSEGREPSDDPSPEEHLLAREQSLELQARLQALPPRLRDPFIMRVHLEMSYAEIAAALKLTNCNARKRIQLAHAALRRSERHDPDD